MNDALGPFLTTWTLMMAAMMLPSTIPMVRLHRLGADALGRVRQEAWSGVFVAGYFVVWASVGIVVWGAAMATDAFVPADLRAIGIAAVLLVGGLYQFTPLKSTCLQACRTPMDFLLTHWHRGLAGQLRLGVEHGLYCLGCCWALMAVFVGAGAMNLVWAAVIAAIVFIEKVVPQGVAVGRVAGAALIAFGLIVLARPEVAGALAGGM